MPTRLDTNFARPTDPDEFESMVRDVCAFDWGDPGTQKFGRKGQKQYGVDVYGQPIDLNGKYRAAQCKLRTKDALTEEEIEAEVKEARSFPHVLDTLIIATDAPRDTHTQIAVDKICKREADIGSFKVAIWFWDDITERLATYPKLIVKYYRDYYANLTTLPIVERLIDKPLQLLSVKLGPSIATSLEDRLRFRGVRVAESDSAATAPRTALSDEILPDGLVCQYNVPLTGADNSSLQKFASTVRIYEQQVESNCPVFVLLPSKLAGQFSDDLGLLGGDIRRIQVLTNGLPVDEIADCIFQSTFNYGHARRGGIATIEIAARASPNEPSFALLDLDWHTQLSTGHFPTPAEWEALFVPALGIVTKQIVGLGDRIRVHINSQLPLPAAFALGFFFNLRVARVGVWARKTGSSDFKRQFWLSDNDAADISYTPGWIRPLTGNCRSAVIELTTQVSIHKTVDPFVKKSGLTAEAWVELSLDEGRRTIVTIDESYAVAYASQVGMLVRRLNEQGVTDTHLFARVPSALAVLIGQRLQACGRIHLYWFDNPTYQFAFTLR